MNGLVDLTAVPAGYQFPAQPVSLDVATVASYVAAVEDDAPWYSGPSALVPSLAVLALAMRGLADLLAQHPGTVHVSQRLVTHRTVPVGTEVVAQLTVQSRSERRGFAALSLEVRVEEAASLVLEGAMLLLVPLVGSGANNA
jgi:hypothetical protein